MINRGESKKRGKERDNVKNVNDVNKLKRIIVGLKVWSSCVGPVHTHEHKNKEEKVKVNFRWRGKS